MQLAQFFLTPQSNAIHSICVAMDSIDFFFVHRPLHSGKAYEGTCRIPRQNGDGRGRRLGKKKDSHSVCRGLYMKCLIWEDTWEH